MDWTAEVQLVIGVRIVSLCHCIQILALRLTQPPIQGVLGSLSLAVKGHGMKLTHLCSPPFLGKVKDGSKGFYLYTLMHLLGMVLN
jgi:hypothetical protein